MCCRVYVLPSSTSAVSGSSRGLPNRMVISYMVVSRMYITLNYIAYFLTENEELHLHRFCNLNSSHICNIAANFVLCIFTRQYVVVPPLKGPTCLGVSQNLAISQIGYITSTSTKYPQCIAGGIPLLQCTSPLMYTG